MSNTESPGDNVDHAAQMRDVLADAREDREEIKLLTLKLVSVEHERDKLINDLEKVEHQRDGLLSALENAKEALDNARFLLSKYF